MKRGKKKSNLATCYELCEHILTQAAQWRPAVSTNYVVGPLPAREARFQKHKLFQGKPQWLYYTLGSGRTSGFAFIWESREVPHPEHRPASPRGATETTESMSCRLFLPSYNCLFFKIKALVSDFLHRSFAANSQPTDSCDPKLYFVGI